MVVNFTVYGISRDMYKLTQISILIIIKKKKKNIRLGAISHLPSCKHVNMWASRQVERENWTIKLKIT
jgi:hypothetical protein